MKGKNSIALLRSSLQMTGENFGKFFSVGQPMVSKWEKDVSTVSPEKKEEISKKFDIPLELFVNDVDLMTERIITEAAMNYRNRMNCNIDPLKHEGYYDSNMQSKVDEVLKRVRDLFNEKPEAVNLVIAAVEKYAYGHYKGRALDGKSDYRSGKIDRKDPCLNNIASALELALGKHK